MAIPVLALIVAASSSAGGLQAMLIALEGTIRQAFTSVFGFVTSLF